MKKLFLVDISSFIFRAYYAIRPLSTKNGIPTNAVYGVSTMMLKLMKDHNPDHLIVCKDREGKGIRHEIFPEYKANRSAPPEDLVPQFELIDEFIKKYPFNAVDCKGYEADDIIATLVKKYKGQKDLEIYIVSSDKDLMQLLDKNVFLFDTMKNKVLKEKDVEAKFGVGPDKVIDVQALCGDSTDNIPGVAGVGPKTAAKLVNEFGDLQGVLDNADQVKGKMGEKLQNGKDDAILSEKLVRLYDDLKLELDWEELEQPQKDQPALNEFFQKVEFTKLIEGDTPKSNANSKVKVADFVLIDSLQKLKGIASNIKVTKPKVLAFDTETDSIDSLNCNLVGISLCYDKKTAYYIPIGHNNSENLKLDDVKELLGPHFTNPELPKIAQNAKYDLNVLSQYGFEVTPIQDDTLISSYLVDPSGKHNLDFLADKYLGYQTTAYSDTVEKGKTFADVDLATATKYAAEDAWVCLMLNKEIQKDLKENELTKVYSQIEMPLVPVLAKMEQNGVLIDVPFLEKLEAEFSKRLDELENNIYGLAGEEFNINSPKQLSVILFEKLELPVIKKTKTGFSTDVRVLTELADQHDLPKFLLEYRSLSKLQSTYVIQLKNILNPKTGRIHSNFNQAIVATGRLSSTEPNLQNIPIKTEEGKKIRQAFIANKGSKIFSADYSQIELRLLAEFTKDPALVDAYKTDKDIHATTAANIFGINIDDVDSTQRNIGKTINFGVMYGQSAFGLAQQLKIPNGEAKHFIDEFYRTFSKVKDYKETILEEAREKGYVSTYMGRKRYLPDLNSKNKLSKQNAERVAFNTVFQGSAADLIKKAMVDIDNWMMSEKLESKMIMQVHDELIFEVVEAEQELLSKKVPELMEKAFKLSIPLKVSSSYGENWAQAH